MPLWQELLQVGKTITAPWLGGRLLSTPDGRSWRIQGILPEEYGWYQFDPKGRKLRLVQKLDPTDEELYKYETTTGYLVGNRLIPDDARVDPDPKKLVEQTLQVYLVEQGTSLFDRVRVLITPDDKHIYLNTEFPLGPETEVREALDDKKETLDEIRDISPALDLAFRWLSHQRDLHEKREEEARRVQRVRELIRRVGTADGRRELAQIDFKAAATQALKVGNAEYLSHRPGYRQNETVVRYRLRNQRFECVVDTKSLSILDSGICLEDHETGIKGDTWFTLESLPAVVEEAIDTHKLVVWRRG